MSLVCSRVMSWNARFSEPEMYLSLFSKQTLNIYSSSSRLRPSFLPLSSACSRFASWNARFSFLKTNLQYFFVVVAWQQILPWPISTLTSLSSSPLSPLNASYTYVFMCVCICVFIYIQVCIHNYIQSWMTIKKETYANISLFNFFLG